MRIAPSGLVGDAIGAVGTIVFKHTAQGPVAQHRPRYQPKRGAQARTQKAILAAQLRAWQALSGTTRQLWTGLAAQVSALRAGHRPGPSGMGLFLGINIQRAFFAVATLSAPPSLPTQDSPWREPVIQWTPNPYLWIHFDHEPLLTGETLLVYRSAARSAARNTIPTGWCQWTKFVGPNSSPSVTWLMVPAPGVKTAVWVKCVKISSARLPSMPTYSKVVWA